MVSTSNGQVIMTSETYYTKSNAKRAAGRLLANLNLGYKEL